MKSMMNFIFLSLATFATLIDVSHAGGQSGGGGNGCWIGNSHEWMMLEEILHAETFNSLKVPAWKQNIYLRKGRYFLRPTTYVYEADLSDNSFFRNGITHLQKLKNTYPETHQVIRELFDLLKHVYVSPALPSGIYDGSVKEEDLPTCSHFSPGIITFEDGTIVVFGPLVASLKHTTMNALFVHESLRFAQMFHPAFSDLSNNDLELLTSGLFDEKLPSIVEPFLSRIETKLKKRDFQNLEIGPEDSLAKRLWLHEINLALKSERPLGTVLNRLKSENGSYGRASRKALEDFLNM